MGSQIFQFRPSSLKVLGGVVELVGVGGLFDFSVSFSVLFIWSIGCKLINFNAEILDGFLAVKTQLNKS